MCCLLIVLTAIAQSAAMGSANCGRAHPPRASERDVAGAVCGVSYSASLKKYPASRRRHADGRVGKRR